MNFSYKHIVLFFGVLSLILIVVFFRVHTEKGVEQDMLENSSVAVKKWSEEIRRVGAKQAYEELKSAAVTLNPGVQHGLGHLFGQILYQTEGIDGFTVCDASLSYGCFHELVGRAIAKTGIGIILELDQKCAHLQNNIGCQHGIGHGILAHFGYKKEDFKAAHSKCASLPDDNPLEGCDAGVLMEYNLRTMSTGLPHDGSVRQPGVDGLLEPCSRLAEKDAPACYFWQTQWWWVYFNNDKHEGPDKALLHTAFLCEKTATFQSRDMCTRGVGRMTAAASLYDPKRAASLCGEVFTKEGDRLLCRSYAANVFYTTQSSSVAKIICEDLEGKARLFCNAYATGEASIGNPLVLPASL